MVWLENREIFKVLLQHLLSVTTYDSHDGISKLLVCYQREMSQLSLQTDFLFLSLSISLAGISYRYPQLLRLSWLDWTSWSP